MKDELLVSDLTEALKWALDVIEIEPEIKKYLDADDLLKALAAIARAERRTLPDALAAVTAVAQSIQE
jgi:hypothetical protein